MAALGVFFAQLHGHVTLSQVLRRGVLRNGVAVAGVAVHANALPLLPGAFIAILAGADVPVSLLELSVQADDGHGVGGVAVVAPHRSVASFAHAVADLGQVELVQQVLVEAGVLVYGVVLGVAVSGRLCCSVVELNLVVELDVSGGAGEAVALLSLFGGCRRNGTVSIYDNGPLKEHSRSHTWTRPLTTVRGAVVGVVRVSDVKRHLAFLIVGILAVSDIERHPALLRGWQGLNGGTSICKRGGRCTSVLQDGTVGLFQFSLLHQGSLDGAGGLDIAYV